MFIDPVAFRIGPIAIHWYGIIFAVAAVAAAWLASREARRRGEDPDRVWTMLLVAAVGGIIGARIYHVIHEWDLIYSQRPELIPQIWMGGLGIPGGVAGGLVALAIYTRVQGLKFWRWIDVGAPALLLAQAIGRFGNFVNQELYGPPTDLPWGIPIDEAHRVPPWTDLDQYPVDSTFFHPLFLYESLLNLLGMFVLLLVGRRYARRLYDGDIAMMYFIWYGSVRTLLEGFRTGNWLIGGIPTAAIIGMTVAVIGAAVIIIRHLKGWGAPGAFVIEMEEREAAAAAKEMVSEGGPVDAEPPSTEPQAG
ncbi:MAG TPA: prolipoprotein diacylglyceryl transferase [Candidatus Limnocylindria bacterium]|nr:prolipoprotein diacylglyceryl transferase [Candidatus Limnocylindria bacterium]